MTEQQEKIHNEAVALIETIDKLNNEAVERVGAFLKPIQGIRKATLVSNFVTLLDKDRKFKDHVTDIVNFEVELKKELKFSKKQLKTVINQ